MVVVTQLQLPRPGALAPEVLSVSDIAPLEHGQACLCPMISFRDVWSLKTEQVPALQGCGEKNSQRRKGWDVTWVSSVTVAPDLPGHQADAQKTLLQSKWQTRNETAHGVPGSIFSVFHGH